MKRPAPVTRGNCPVTGKVRYRDALAARLAVASAPVQRRRPGGKDERRAYRCPHCGAFHVTSKGRAA